MKQRATNMGAAFVNAVVKQDPKQKNWVSRTVVDRALHTNVGNVTEFEDRAAAHKTAVKAGLTH